MGKHTLLLKKWTPNLYSLDDSAMQAPVWVKLHGLPLEFCVEDVFKGIANTFGELLSLYLVTISRRRLYCVRFCVGASRGVDLMESIALKFKLGVWDQRIEYESIPFACFLCKKVCH